MPFQQTFSWEDEMGISPQQKDIFVANRPSLFSPQIGTEVVEAALNAYSTIYN